MSETRVQLQLLTHSNISHNSKGCIWAVSSRQSRPRSLPLLCKHKQQQYHHRQQFPRCGRSCSRRRSQAPPTTRTDFARQAKMPHQNSNVKATNTTPIPIRESKWGAVHRPQEQNTFGVEEAWLRGIWRQQQVQPHWQATHSKHNHSDRCGL